MEDVNIKPKLRFPEFEGEWEEKRLADISELITKGTTPQNFSESGVNYVKIECLNGINIIKDRCLFISEQTHLKELKRSILKNDDILFAIAGATVGKIGIVTEDILPANTNQALAIIRLKNKRLNTFLIPILSSRRMKKYIFQSMSVGAQPNLSLKQINDFSFAAPVQIEEQQKIASFLTAVDEHIQLLQRKKAKLEAYKKGVMQKLFSQEIRFKVEGPDGELVEPPDWEEKKLGEICNKQSSNISANTLNESEGDYKVYGATGFLQYVDFYREKDAYISIIKDGAGVGRILLCEAKSSVLGTLDILKPKKDNNIQFLYALISNIRFEKYITGSTIPHIYFKDYSKEKVKVPIPAEQLKIAAFLTSLDEAVEAIEIEITGSLEYKRGLLQKMFV